MARRDLRLLGFARRMRRDPTPAEAILWREVRGGALGVRFRRQEPVGRFICDFVCASRRLVVEVDGDFHDDPLRDARRDPVLRGLRYTVVLRFWDTEVFENRDGVLDDIAAHLCVARCRRSRQRGLRGGPGGRWGLYTPGRLRRGGRADEGDGLENR